MTKEVLIPWEPAEEARHHSIRFRATDLPRGQYSNLTGYYTVMREPS